MERKLLLLLVTLCVLAVSGCIMETPPLTSGDQNASWGIEIVNINGGENQYRCPTGEYVSDASECPYYCGDDECSAGETYTTCPGDCCYSAMVVIAGAEYSDEDSILTLHINNAGDFELSFSAVVEYDDASMKIIKSLYTVPAGQTESVKIENVDSNMESVRIIAAECPEVEDFITKEHITGL